ncbi:FecR family protein [Bordetella genomosp. 4]|uniref:FecR family protein n=1 Tax=Bordetella genomosp. 4 TaxID=463044 RepID=UPI000B9ECF5E|nr:FecR domain-containing protein [Bordetella genomosp. 4]OZI48880.1 iron dicitrate transport regulator FecR [Bordetella genomosp. 4]
MPPFSHASPLANQAIDWLLLLRSGRATQLDYAEFRAWRDAHPQHHQAWQNLTTSIDGAAFDQADDSHPPSSSASYSRRRFLARAGLTVLVGGATAYACNAVYPLQNLASDAATGTSERRRYTLTDGSSLLLDARSSLDLSYTPYLRQLNLQSGAVTIEAAANESRPFLTKTAEGLIRSHGARYMVRQQSHRTLVVAHDEPIEIQTRAGAHTILQPGMGIRFDALRLGEPSREMATRAAWEHGRIVARDVTLNEVVETLRPYYSGTLRVTVAAGGLPVSGEYSLDDVSGTLRSLEQSLPITVLRFTPWVTSIAVASA